MKKKTQVVDRNYTPRSGEFQPGMITELMVAGATCPVEHLLGTYVTILPGGFSQLRKHTNAECAWYLVKGSLKEIFVAPDGTVTEEIAEPGDAGYVKPGDAHQEINLSDLERVEMIMCFANPDNEKCNCFEDLGTEVVEGGYVRPALPDLQKVLRGEI